MRLWITKWTCKVLAVDYNMISIRKAHSPVKDFSNWFSLANAFLKNIFYSRLSSQFIILKSHVVSGLQNSQCWKSVWSVPRSITLPYPLVISISMIVMHITQSWGTSLRWGTTLCLSPSHNKVCKSCCWFDELRF